MYAPVDGTVIRVGNDWIDHAYARLWQGIRLWYDATFQFRPRAENGRLDIRPNAGNHVMIQAREGHIVLLAHLRNRSITVAEGAQVRHGDVVGMVGSSGNSAIPHLPSNLFDRMENPLEAKVLPFVFRSYETLARGGRRVVQESALPDAGAVVRVRIPDGW